MRISDWSSDVCSSDLVAIGVEDGLDGLVVTHRDHADHLPRRHQGLVQHHPWHDPEPVPGRYGEHGRLYRAVAVAMDDPEFHSAARPEGRPRRLQVAGQPRHVRTVVGDAVLRSEEHTSELKSLMRISYAVLRLKKKTTSTCT